MKQTSLLLLSPEGDDESADIGDIRVIKVVKKSKLGLVAFGGIPFGAKEIREQWQKESQKC